MNRVLRPPDLRTRTRICARTHLLELLELVDAEDACGVTAVAADLLAEARAPAGVADGQLVGVHPRVAVERAQRLLGRRNQVLLVRRGVVLVLAAVPTRGAALGVQHAVL